MATVKSFKADISSISPSSERMEQLWVVCVCLYAEMELHYRWEYVTLHGKTDTNAFPFKLQNRLLSIYIRLNGSWKRLNGLLIRLKKFASI